MRETKKAPVLRLENVSKVLDGKTIIEDVFWTVRRGVHWVLLGANGAGKTTLMNIITGYLWPTEGEVYVLGKKFGAIDLRELRKDIGYVSSILLENVPARDLALEVVLSGKFASLGLYDAPSEEDEGRAKYLLDMMGCSNIADKEFGKLSQGEQQKVLISRALMPDPDLLILDEPAIGLDPAARERFLDKIEEIGSMKSGPVLIYITHHLEEITPIFSRVLILKEGEVLEKGRKEEVLKDGIMSEAFGIDMEVVRKNNRFFAVRV